MPQMNYAIIGNCQISALLDHEATYVWCCMPRFDSPSIFASLLDTPNAGYWSVLPEGEYRSTQRYYENTNVLSTRFELSTGERYEVIDFAPRFYLKDTFFRPPQLIRIIRPLSGSPRVTMRLNPSFNYGSVRPRAVPSGTGITYEGDGQSLFLASDIPSSYIMGETSFTLTSTRYAVLSYGRPFELPLKFGTEEYLDRTLSYWKLWVKHSSIPFEFQKEVIRSALALKLHIYEDTGAIIAATTTSLPEGPTGGRCWDYRFCWLRDSYFVIAALNRLGHFDEMEHFIEYLHNLALGERSAHLQPVFGIGGERVLEERELPWLKGFKGIGPVRVGNAAYTHHQHDVYGEMVLAIAPIFFDRRLDRQDLGRVFETVKRLVDQAVATFDLGDAGLWEFRSEHRHYLFSKLLSWVAADRGVRIAQRVGDNETAERWAIEASRMREAIEKRGWNAAQGQFSQAFGVDAADASNLLMAQFGFLPWTDERYRAMVDAFGRKLKRGSFITRYVNPDDFGVPETAFTVCSFWMVEALHGVGRTGEARELFQLLCSRANHLGLLSEDVAPETGELWGNFPQTYSHVGLINAAMRISKSWDEAF
jgi:GH15 family glucan-1,4-alpha-glucosidase